MDRACQIENIRYFILSLQLYLYPQLGGVAMKRKITTMVLSVIILAGTLGLVGVSALNAVDLWDRIYTRQSDLMYKYLDMKYKYSSSYTYTTKYWNPMSTINQRYYPPMSNLTYKYTMPNINLKYATPPNLTLKYMDMLPPLWNQRYNLPTANLDFKYLDKMLSLNQGSSFASVIQSSRPIDYNDNITVTHPYTNSPLTNNLPSGVNMVSYLHKDFKFGANLYDYYRSIPREPQLLWDFFSFSRPRIILEKIPPTTTLSTTLRNATIDFISLLPAIRRDLATVRQGTYSILTSHTLETGASLVLSKMPWMWGTSDLTKAVSSWVGRGQPFPNIDETDLLLRSVTKTLWGTIGYRQGFIAGGPKMAVLQGKLYASGADLVITRGQQLTMPIFQSWANRGVYSQNLESLKTLNIARAATGLNPLSYNSVYGSSYMNNMNLLRWNTFFNWHYQMPTFNSYNQSWNYGRW